MSVLENLIDTKIQAIAYDVAIEKLEAIIHNGHPEISSEKMQGIKAALMTVQTSYMEAQDRYDNS